MTLADDPECLALLRLVFLALSTWARPVEENSMTGKNWEKRNIAAMGEEKGKQFSLPGNEVAILDPHARTCGTQAAPVPYSTMY